MLTRRARDTPAASGGLYELSRLEGNKASSAGPARAATGRSQQDFFRQSLKLWKEKCEEEGREGLRDRSHAPNISPLKIYKELEEEIVRLRKRSGFGARRVKVRITWMIHRFFRMLLSANCREPAFDLYRSIARPNGFATPTRLAL